VVQLAALMRAIAAGIKRGSVRRRAPPISSLSPHIRRDIGLDRD
jgi:hypothetical protein